MTKNEKQLLKRGILYGIVGFAINLFFGIFPGDLEFYGIILLTMFFGEKMYRL